MLTEADTETGTQTEEPPPDPIKSENLWDLEANPSAIHQAAAGWRELAKAANRQATRVGEAAKRVYDTEWRGETADSYAAHRNKLTSDIREIATLADRAATALESAAESLSSAQDRLKASWERLTTVCPYTVNGRSVTFQPQDDSDVKAVNDAISEAKEIRTHLDEQLVDAQVDLSKAESDFKLVSAAWLSAVSGTPPFELPPEATGTGVIVDRDNNRFIINTGPGDDTVEVRIDPETGARIVVVNGVEYPVPEGMEITVRTGEGNDTITVPPGTRINFTVLGGGGNDTVRGGAGNERVVAGAGDDTVDTGDGDDRVSGGSGMDTIRTGAGADIVTGGRDNDRIETGEGDDYASGGEHRDYISGYRGSDSLHGGAGDDVVYSGSGTDIVTGGDGRDYLDGGRDNDVLDGGSGADIVSGGRGGDTVRGGSGDDTLLSGEGKDTVDAGAGDDTAYTQRDDSTTAEHVVHVEITDAGSRIRIEGSDEFRERVQDDLDTLRSLPNGSQMLAEMDDLTRGLFQDTIVIREETDPDSGNSVTYRGRVWMTHEIHYKPHGLESVDERPPVVGLFHEMAHVYDHGNGVAADGNYEGSDTHDHGVENDERQATGLTVTEDGFWPWDETTERMHPDHPFELTENGLRDALGLPRREHYRDY